MPTLSGNQMASSCEPDGSMAKEEEAGASVGSAADQALPHSAGATESDSDSHQGLEHTDETDLPIELPLPGGSLARDRDGDDSATSNPVVVHVPSMCPCGCVVVGVWYCKVAYYCEWFRHPR